MDDEPLKHSHPAQPVQPDSGFAEGERTIPETPVEEQEPDFARGERTGTRPRARGPRPLQRGPGGDAADSQQGGRGALLRGSGARRLASSTRAPSARTSRPPRPRGDARTCAVTSSATSRARRFDRSISTLEAPLSTTSDHGCASAAPSATASPGSAASRPLAIASLTITPRPAVVRARQRPLGRPLVEVPRRLHGVERAGLERAVDRRRLPRPGDAEADRDAGAPQRGELAEHVRVLEHAALDRRRMDLVQPQMVPEVRARLARAARAGARR